LGGEWLFLVEEGTLAGPAARRSRAAGRLLGLGGRRLGLGDGKDARRVRPRYRYRGREAVRALAADATQHGRWSAILLGPAPPL